MIGIAPQAGETNRGNDRFPLWKKIVLALISFLGTFAALEIASRLYIPAHAPVLLRDGIYVNALPLVTGLVAGNFNEKLKGERLPKKKPEGEIRVFVFGESSVQGFPLDAHASAPTMLHDLLKESAPELDIKVINMGRAGSISADVFYYLLFAKLYDPDFIIFYMGMNDSGGMPGEQCMPVRNPIAHRIWRWFVSRSSLLWTVRVFGPLLVWTLGNRMSEKNPEEWDCPEPPFPLWTDILTETALSTGAKVIVTTPVHSAVAGIEPPYIKKIETSSFFDEMPDFYRKLLRCRLTAGCDFVAHFKEFDAGISTKEISGGRENGLIGKPLEEHEKQMDFYSSAWKNSAAEYGAVFIDFRMALKEISPHQILADKYFADEIHLTVEGYNYLARFWKEEILSILKGTSPEIPAAPSAEEVQRYIDSTKVTGVSMLMSYLQRGWFLTSITGLEVSASRCPSGKCDEWAILALAWLRHKIGLPHGLPPDLAQKLDAFNPADYNR